MEQLEKESQKRSGNQTLTEQQKAYQRDKLARENVDMRINPPSSRG